MAHMRYTRERKIVNTLEGDDAAVIEDFAKLQRTTVKEGGTSWKTDRSGMPGEGAPIRQPKYGQLSHAREAGQYLAERFAWEERHHVSTNKGSNNSAFAVAQTQNGTFDLCLAHQTRNAKTSPPSSDEETLQIWAYKGLAANSAVHGNTHFRATVAKFFCDALQAERVVDASAGWGDRFTGFAASKSAKEVVLIDPRKNACVGYQKQLQFLKDNGFCEDLKLRVYNEPAEEALPKLVKEAKLGSLRSKNSLGHGFYGYDLCMTSPPYDCAEYYGVGDSDSAGQCWETYRTSEEYLTKFLYVLIDLQAQLLNVGGWLVLNIDDPVSNRVATRICQPALDHADKNTSLQFYGTYGLWKSGPKRCEPIYVFRKRASAFGTILPPLRIEMTETLGQRIALMNEMEALSVRYVTLEQGLNPPPPCNLLSAMSLDAKAREWMKERTFGLATGMGERDVRSANDVLAREITWVRGEIERMERQLRKRKADAEATEDGGGTDGGGTDGGGTDDDADAGDRPVADWEKHRGFVEEHIVDLSPYTWEMLAGQEHAKDRGGRIVRSILKPHGTKATQTPNGLLLTGPPGTGKTLFAKIVAHQASESGCIMIELGKPFYDKAKTKSGASLVEALFAIAVEREPCIILMDECDGAFKAVNNVAEWKRVWQRVDLSKQGPRVLVVGTTNNADKVDSAILSRFDAPIVFKPLSDEALKHIAEQTLREEPYTLDEDGWELVLKMVRGCDGDFVVRLCMATALYEADTSREAQKDRMIRIDHFQYIYQHDYSDSAAKVRGPPSAEENEEVDDQLRELYELTEDGSSYVLLRRVFNELDDASMHALAQTDDPKVIKSARAPRGTFEEPLTNNLIARIEACFPACTKHRDANTTWTQGKKLSGWSFRYLKLK